MNLFFDFDSTIIQTESLDEFAKLVLKNDKRKIAQIEEITRQGMRGDIDFNQSLLMRLELFTATKSDITQLIIELKKSISPSIVALKSILAEYKANCYIISGGFIDYILPICVDLGFLKENIFANQFTFQNDKIIGFENTNLLSKSNGKATIIKSLNLSTPTIMIGDGYTDLEVKLEQVAEKMIAFTENVTRINVVKQADSICQNFYQVYDYINSQKL